MEQERSSTTVFTWSINNFSEKMESATGIESSDFMTIDHTNEIDVWKLLLFTREIDNDVEHQDIHVYLSNVSKLRPVNISIQIGVLGYSFAAIDDKITFHPENFWCSMGYKLISQEELLKRRKSILHNNDTLRLKCRITAFDPEKKMPLLSIKEYCHRGIGLDLAGLLNSEYRPDFTIQCGMYEFKCHQLILAIRCPYFKGMMETTEMKEQRNNRCTEIIDPNIMQHILLYIYSGRGPSLLTRENEDWAAIVQDLFVAADRYLLEDLKLLCEHYMCEEINFQNWGSYLLLSKQHHAKQLTKSTMDFLINNRDCIMNDPEWTENYKKLETNTEIIKDILETALSDKYINYT